MDALQRLDSISLLQGCLLLAVGSGVVAWVTRHLKPRWLRWNLVWAVPAGLANLLYWLPVLRSGDASEHAAWALLVLTVWITGGIAGFLLTRFALWSLWWFRISRAVGREEHATVLALAEDVLRRDAKNQPALTFAALHAEALGLEQAALDHARRALALDPDDFELHCLRVRLLDPDHDRVELEETARWLVALSETTQPARDKGMDEALASLQRLPLSKRLKRVSEKEGGDYREARDGYLGWARDFLAGRVE